MIDQLGAGDRPPPVGDRQVLLWDFTNQNRLRTDALEQACSITRRGLTPDEWAAYVSGLPYTNACAR